MPNFKLTEAAKKDLRGISTYTEETWDKKQEIAYRETIRAGLRVIAKNPEIGTQREELTKGLRSFFPVGQHIAYYVEGKADIEVARILDPAMDTENARLRPMK